MVLQSRTARNLAMLSRVMLAFLPLGLCQTHLKKGMHSLAFYLRKLEEHFLHWLNITAASELLFIWENMTGQPGGFLSASPDWWFFICLSRFLIWKYLLFLMPKLFWNNDFNLTGSILFLVPYLNFLRLD